MVHRARRLAGALAVAAGLVLGIPAGAAADAFEPRSGCQLQATHGYHNEASTTSSLFAPSTGTLRAILVFVDYSDADGGDESTAALAESFGPEAERWYDRVSRGRLQLDVDAGPDWREMPKPSSEYRFDTAAQRHQHLTDAVATVDDEVDFSRYQILLVVSSRGQHAFPTSAFSFPEDGGIATADGSELRWGAWFGNQARLRPDPWAARTLVHELGHGLGLPDLYRYRAATWTEQNEDVGFWDLMSWHGTGVLYSAWHQRKLGWLDADEMECVTSEPARRTLAPLDGLDGVKALAVPTGPSTAYVVESRRRSGEDDELCDGGVLVYRVDAAAYGGNRPVVVKIAREGTPDIFTCGPQPFAGFDRTGDEVCRFEDAEENVRIEVLGRRDEGHDVRVSPLSAPPHPNSASCAEAAPAEPAEPTPPSEPDGAPPTGEDPGGRPGLTPPLTEARSRDGERPPAVVTRTPLGVRLIAPRALRLGRRGTLTVTARCDAPCSVRALATVDLPRTRRDPVVRSPSRSGARGAAVRLTLRLDAAARRRVSAQLRRGRTVPVRITLSGRSADGRAGTSAGGARLGR
jgi:M6 family metalloprotease-like protein